ncbi:MAG: heme o synthase, partial [Candidatus Bathyarchaeia archaeon]
MMKMRGGAVRAYLELTKPRIWGLLTFTSFATMLLASAEIYGRASAGLVGLGLASISMAGAGSEAVTSYLERDIDGRMTRTRHRPVPSGRISPPRKALYFGVALLAVSLGLAGAINAASLILVSLGALNNILIYTILAKRTTSLNILFGSFGGAAPTLFGWAVVAGALSLPAVLLAFLIIVWTPWHIWALAYCYREDYRGVGVPMLTAVKSEKTSVGVIASAALVMVAFSIGISHLGVAGIIYSI